MDVRSQITAKQRKAKSLIDELRKLTMEVEPTNAMRKEINRVRLECIEKQREIGQKYIQKEIDILKDPELKFAE